MAFPTSGWLLINKPKGMTSTKVVSMARRALKIKKIGHAGTLDPLAEGVLPLAFGEATKTIPYAMDASKEYEFTIKFGEATSTEDAEGDVIETSDVMPKKEQIEAVLPLFVGEISQVPPAFSALKVDGKRAYDLARKGQEVVLKPRQIKIHDLTLLGVEGNEATFRVGCGKGTYVRSLARDIAKQLESCGHVTMLKRTRVGKFLLKSTISLEKLEKICHSAPPFDGIRPIGFVLDDILVLPIDLNQVAEIRYGRKIKANDASLKEGELALYHQEQLIAIACHQNGEIRPLRVFNN